MSQRRNWERHYKRKQELYWERRDYAFAQLGGKRCKWCGSCVDVTLDHINRFDKQVPANRLSMVSHARFLAEIPRMQALCIYCHAWKSNHERHVRQPIEMAFNWETGLEAPVLLMQRWEEEARAEEIDWNETDSPF